MPKCLHLFDPVSQNACALNGAAKLELLHGYDTTD